MSFHRVAINKLHSDLSPISPPDSDEEIDMNPPPATEDDLLPPPPVDDGDELPAPDTPDDCPEFDESDTPGSPPPPMSSSRFPNRHTPPLVRGIACNSEDDLPSPPESPYVRLTKGFRSVLSSSKSRVAAMPSTDSCDGPGEDISSPPTEDIDDANYQHNHRHQQQSRALTLCDEDDDLPSPHDSEDERDMNLRPAQDVDFETPLPSPKQHANGSNQPSSPKQIIREGEISVENEVAALTNAEVTAVEGGASDRPGSDSNLFLAASGDGFTGSSSGSLRGRAPRRRHSDVDRTVSASADLAVRRSGARLSVVRGKNPAWITARQWKLGQKIGSGSFGGVFQGMNDKGCLFAVKRMNVVDKPNYVRDLLTEIQLMRGLSHPHIVEYLGAYVDQEEEVLFIFQEWVPGGSIAYLLQKFGPFTVGVVREYTRQILQGLQYLHSNGIVHRDIKGGNVLIAESGQVKLADFGASVELSQFDQTQETSTIKGTPYFMAPEVLASTKYGRKGDVWAVGCTMIQMLTGQPPWKDRDIRGLVQLHLLLSSRAEGPPPYDCEVTAECRACLEMCFRNEACNRPSVAELLQCDFLREEDESDGEEQQEADYASAQNISEVDDPLLLVERRSSSFMFGRGDEHRNDSLGVTLNSDGTAQDEMGDSLVIQKLQDDLDAVLSKSRANSLAVGERVSEGSPVILDDERRKKALELMKSPPQQNNNQNNNVSAAPRLTARPDNPFSSVRRTHSSGV